MSYHVLSKARSVFSQLMAIRFEAPRPAVRVHEFAWDLPPAFGWYGR
jgi:hypothetical protein